MSYAEKTQMYSVRPSRRSRQSTVKVEAIAAERRWTLPSTNGRVKEAIFNGNVAWKEQLITPEKTTKVVKQGT